MATRGRAGDDRSIVGNREPGVRDRPLRPRGGSGLRIPLPEMARLAQGRPAPRVPAPRAGQRIRAGLGPHGAAALGGDRHAHGARAQSPGDRGAAPQGERRRRSPAHARRARLPRPDDDTALSGMGVHASAGYPVPARPHWVEDVVGGAAS